MTSKVRDFIRRINQKSDERIAIREQEIDKRLQKIIEREKREDERREQELEEAIMNIFERADNPSANDISMGYSIIDAKLELVREQEINLKNTMKKWNHAEEISLGMCKICYDNTVNILLEPCMHACLCVECSEICGDLCPICRVFIRKTIKFYLC